MHAYIDYMYIAFFSCNTSSTWITNFFYKSEISNFKCVITFEKYVTRFQITVC